MKKKEKIQLAVIGVIILGVLVVVGINYGDRFLPQPVGEAEQFSAPDRPDNPVSIDTKLFKRQEYTQMQSFGPLDLTLPDDGIGDPALEENQPTTMEDTPADLDLGDEPETIDILNEADLPEITPIQP